MKKAFALAISLYASTSFAEMVVPMHQVDENGVNDKAGDVTITESEFGLVFTPSLQGLSPGLHGFHVHQNPSCEPAEKEGKVVGALGAGGHYDPKGSGKHDTPWGDGHLGDLPPLYVAADGSSSQPVLAPRLTMDDLSGRALMIHAGGDNHSDHPAALGGGGARVVCGVIQ